MLLVSTLTSGQFAVTIGVLTTFLTAVVSAVGLLINRQAERRAGVQQADELARLRLEAAMHAAELLNGDAEKAAAPAAVASGLLALTDLDRPDLAVALLVDVWDQRETPAISAEAAILVLNAALMSPQRNAQLVAAELLCRNAQRLDACQSLHWPTAIDGCWSADFAPRTKLLLVDALVRMTYTSDANENALRSIAVRLYAIWQTDSSERVKRCIGVLINAILPALKALHYEDFMGGPIEVSMTQLVGAAVGEPRHSDGLLERISLERSNELRRWADRCREPRFEPGALAATFAGGIA